MKTKDFILLGAGYAAGRLSKKINAGPIGAVTRFELIKRKPFIEARKKDAKYYLNKFKWDSSTKSKLEEIAAKGYFVEGKKIYSVMIPLTGSKKLSKSRMNFFVV